MQSKLKANYKHKRQIETRRKRILMFGGVILLAVVFTGLLISQSGHAQPVAIGSYIPVTPQTWPNADGKSLGNPASKIVVQEFADFQCPYCRQFHDTIMPQIIKDYIATGKIRFEYHHFIVIDGNTGGNESHRAAEASECANEQGRFWDFYNMLFTDQQGEASGAFEDARLKTFAVSLGLDSVKFNSCFDSGKDTALVNLDQTLAISKKLSSTPSLLVNNVAVKNPLDYTQIKAEIDAVI